MALHEQCVGATDEWYTPRYVFEAMAETFLMDVASPGEAVTPWVPALKFITERSLGIPCPCETMRRFPFLYPRWLYADTRARISAVNGTTFEGYVFTATNIGGAFHGYSEFNSLGCNAKERHADKFFLYDSAHGGLKPSKVKQYWSHSGLTPREREELEGVVG